MLRRVRPATLRCERGQGAAEYMGMLLLVAVIIGALVASDVPDRIAGATNDMIDLIAGGGDQRGGGGGEAGGGGRGGQPGGGQPGGGQGQDGGSGDGGADPTALAVCLSS